MTQLTDYERDRAEQRALAGVRGATILTIDGVYFDFDDPAAGGITLNAIARGLANTVRFGGQCRRFYSVAEHSVHVSRAVPLAHAQAALLHDGAEAFAGDMVKPLKMNLPEYHVIESRIEAAIFARYGIATPLPPTIKAADRALLKVEQRQVMANQDGWAWTSEWADCMGRQPNIEFLTPDAAFDQFMARAKLLGLVDTALALGEAL